MIDPVVPAKLEGLRTALLGELENPRHQNYGGPRVVALFQRYETIRAEMTKTHPSLFSEFTQIPIPDGGAEGELPIRRHQIQMLLVEVESIKSVLQAYSGTQPLIPAITREGVFFAGQTFDAVRSVQNLIEVASSAIWLIDNFLDSSVFDLFTAKVSQVALKILTKDVSPSLNLAAQKFNQQYGKLEIRTPNPFHDRFLVIDDKDLYHFGASFKDLGRRGFMFSRIEEPSVIDQLKAEIVKTWNSSSVAM